MDGTQEKVNEENIPTGRRCRYTRTLCTNYVVERLNNQRRLGGFRVAADDFRR